MSAVVSPLPHIARVALDGIDIALRKIFEPTGIISETGPQGTEQRHTYRVNTDQEKEAVREALIGAAFVVGQTFLRMVPQWTATMSNINHVANYWKHRDDWDAAWAHPRIHLTAQAVRALGASPPVQLGQLTQLARTVLGGSFDTIVLWSKLNGA